MTRRKHTKIRGCTEKETYQVKICTENCKEQAGYGKEKIKIVKNI